MYNENELQVSDRSDKLDQKENDKLSVYLTQKGLLVSSYHNQFLK